MVRSRFLFLLGAVLLLGALLHERTAAQPGYGDNIQEISGTITASQMRNLNATPVTVIAAPGTGQAIWIESAQFMLDFNANAYDSVGAGEDIQLQYATSNAQAVAPCDTVGCLQLNSTSDAFGFASDEPAVGAGGWDPGTAAEAVEIINNGGGEWAAADLDANGDSPMRYVIRYRVVNLDLS